MSEDLLALTAQIVSAHVTKNTVEVADLPALIRDVFRTLSGLGEAPRNPRRKPRNRRCRRPSPCSPRTSSAWNAGKR